METRLVHLHERQLDAVAWVGGGDGRSGASRREWMTMRPKQASGGTRLELSMSGLCAFEATGVHVASWTKFRRGTINGPG